MENVLKLMLLSFTLFSVVVNADDDNVQIEQYGGQMPANIEAVPLKQALALLEQGQISQVKVSGQVTEVCQAKGCWMILVDGDQFARITFKDYSFFVPTQTSMQRAVVYGTLEASSLSAETAAHYAQDAGDHEAHDRIIANAAPVIEYSLIASAVQIEQKI